MKSAQTLRGDLRAIDRKSYPAYKSLAGSYGFGKYILHIEHVQGDPFAAPSRVSVEVDQKTAGFPAALRNTRENRTALADYLLRRFRRQSDRFCFQAKGSGKSGVISVTRCGQEVLERTGCEVSEGRILVRFEVGFPANGRTINASELEKILFDFLPVCVEESLLFASTPAGEAAGVIALAEDQQFIRRELERLELAAFVADGSILPRESGASDRPMGDAVPFRAPETMAVTLQLPHRGPLRGLGVRRGITLIAGGGYHGKSTLLKFINRLPNGRDTTRFSTLDASGSTSQAANIVEGLEAGARVLLIDEDTSATNFMVRDELMQRVIARDKEPITPFLERAADLYEKAGVSTVLVVGSCGAYFHIAHQILQMDAYRPVDITASTRALLRDAPAPVLRAPGFQLPAGKRPLRLAGAVQSRKNYRGGGYVQERLKIRRTGKRAFSLGGEELDLRWVEQLADEEQTTALAWLLRWARENAGRLDGTVDGAARTLAGILETEGLAGVCSGGVPSGLAMPRIQEIFACLNRC